MKLHEYQAKNILSSYGVVIPLGKTISNGADLEQVFHSLNTDNVVVKAQVHTGGRGKAGGIKLARGLDEAQQAANDILGMQLRTVQTGDHSFPVNNVLIEQVFEFEREFYMAILLDRTVKMPLFLVSAEGGMEIETLAVEKPEAILKVPIHPTIGILSHQIREIAQFLGLGKEGTRECGALLHALYMAFNEIDASLIEINPLVVTPQEELVALDCKITIDDSALYRHKDIAQLEDQSQEQHRELQAKKVGLSYVALDGKIGCMVNGAGLAMATMDLIKSYGENPANFLDIGGSANKERVSEALRIITADKNVEAILINIFGGIVQCDMVANGVIAAVEEVDLKVPLVVRLQGTNAKEGRGILAKSNLDIIAAETLEEAARSVVLAVR